MLFNIACYLKWHTFVIMSELLHILVRELYGKLFSVCTGYVIPRVDASFCLFIGFSFVSLFSFKVPICFLWLGKVNLQFCSKSGWLKEYEVYPQAHGNSVFSHSLPHSMRHSMIIFACWLLNLEEGHWLTPGCVYFLVPPEVFDLIPHASCSLYVKTVVISRYSSHSMCMCVLERYGLESVNHPCSIQREFGGMKALTTVGGDDVMHGSQLVSLHVFCTSEKTELQRIHLEVSERGIRHRRAIGSSQWMKGCMNGGAERCWNGR